ncbi:MAG: Creatinine amidohydrolase [Firmicutes bacterium ADurb.Bin506]|nr:MAG: Creatinine amidohydrolase [Firmicutes bacterium ADurb.Bin506]
MLHLDPDNVDMSRAVCDISQPKSDFYFRDMTRGGRGVACADLSRHITRTGAVGDGTLATAEKGKVFFEIIVNTLAQFLREFKERKIEVVAEIDITHATTEIH